MSFILYFHSEPLLLIYRFDDPYDVFEIHI